MQLEYEDYDYEEAECSSCQETQQRMDNASDFLTGIIECAYDRWDSEKFEHCLEELSYYLKVKYQPKELKIRGE